MSTMAFRSLVLGGVLLSCLGVACSASTEVSEDEAATQEGALTSLRAVDITVTAKKTGENYEARSYPTDDMDGDGKIELYNAPVYFVNVSGIDRDGNRVTRSWKSPRYMPYYNDPAAPHTEYRTRGFVTAGLTAVARKPVPEYKPNYEVHNRFSPFGGAIVVKGTFYIHAGPAEISESGWGSAGCVEILGNFDDFKKDILELAGSNATDLNKGIGQLVAARKLFVTYESAQRPDLKTMVSREVSANPEDDGTSSDSPDDRSDPNN